MHPVKCVAYAAVLAVVAAPSAHAAQERVLLVNEARGFVHDSIPAATAFFLELGRRSPHYDVVVLTGGAAGLTPRRLRWADAVIFANTSGELRVPDRGALNRFVKGGQVSRHGAVQEARLVVTRRPHPITRGLPRTFALEDEFYEFMACPRPRERLLVRLDPESVPDELGRDLPLVWARRHGEGRVFHDALGHPPSSWTHDVHRRIVARGLA